MDGFREGFRFATDVRFSVRGQCAKKSLDALFCTPRFMPFWPNLDPPRAPFWKFLLFGGHPKIIILRTDSTLVLAENNTNPCINGASAPTFAFLEGSGNQCFFTLFSSRAKVAQEALEVSPGPKMDPQWVPIWEQNDVQNVVAQLPVRSLGADRLRRRSQIRKASFLSLWVSVSLALDLDVVDMVFIFGPAHTSVEGPGAAWRPQGAQHLSPTLFIAGIQREGWKGGRAGRCTYFTHSRLAPITHASHTRVPASRQLGIAASHRTTLAPVGSAWPSSSAHAFSGVHSAGYSRELQPL